MVFWIVGFLRQELKRFRTIKLHIGQQRAIFEPRRGSACVLNRTDIKEIALIEDRREISARIRLLRGDEIAVYGSQMDRPRIGGLAEDIARTFGVAVVKV
jgi:hypothetical protein